MEEIRLWKVTDAEGSIPSVVPVAPVLQTPTEKLLEDVLARAPEVLMPGLHLIGRQNETPNGPLDLLGVDGDGKLVVFELKRGDLTRDAVSQVIDYASFLAGLDHEQLSEHLTACSGRGGTEKIDNFGTWYQQEYQKNLADIGKPRMVLVGLGVEDRAKRMVAFLAQSDVDISLITFHGFEENGQIYLARQVEVQARVSSASNKINKQTNEAMLTERIKAQGIESDYRQLAATLLDSLGTSVYQWPNAGGYSFYLPEITETGGISNRAYLALYVNDNHNGQIQLYFQSRAVEAIGLSALEELGKLFGEKISVKPNGSADLWLSAKNAPNISNALRRVGEEVSAGWKRRRDTPPSVEAIASGRAVEAN